MKIEVLFVHDCPSRLATVRVLREVLAAEGVSAEIREVTVGDAAAANAQRFCGSPTVRINGDDVESRSAMETPGLACRYYPGAEEHGVPPREEIRRAVREALKQENP